MSPVVVMVLHVLQQVAETDGHVCSEASGRRRKAARLVQVPVIAPAPRLLHGHLDMPCARHPITLSYS